MTFIGLTKPLASSLALGLAQVAQYNALSLYRSVCLAEGGDLVSIHSQEENDFVTGLLNPSSWLTWTGGYDCEANEGCKWFDNTAFNYTNWAPGMEC